MIIWIIGMPGAGKTTIGRKVHELWCQRRPKTIFLDGDDVREIFGNDLGHTIEDRRRNGDRICRLCKYFDDQGMDAIVCVLSLFHNQQEWNRKNYVKYVEVFIDVSQEVLERRDQKELYSQAKSGILKNVVGFDIPFIPPPRADMTVRNDGPLEQTDAIARQVVDYATAVIRV